MGTQLCNPDLRQDLNHDGRLFDDRKEFLRRVKLINRYGRGYGAKGFRAAVLYRKPEWYEHLIRHVDTKCGASRSLNVAAVAQ